MLLTARESAQRLRALSQGTGMRVRLPGRLRRTETGGWAANLGSLGHGVPSIEIWLDRFSGHAERKFCACFWSPDPKRLQKLISSCSKRLWPVRRLSEADTTNGRFLTLKKKLSRNDLGAPILEHYDIVKSYFFGFYDRTRSSNAGINAQFCEQAVSFFLDVARAQPRAKEEATPRDVFPRCEDRKWVKSHLRRERSSYLADRCKARDEYRCRACNRTFVEMYGRELGAGFAEAHHIRPLGNLPDRVKTHLDDLVTVCANCHRMLHQMTGERDDLKKLRAIVRMRSSRWGPS